MKPAVERDLEREIARSLVGALEVALARGGALAELRAARDAAQLLSLPGLDRLVAALAPHASRPWPTEIQPVVERLQRVSARAAAAGGLEEFRRADADFHALAGEIVAMEWSSLPSRGGVEGPSVPTLSAAEMLSDLSLAGDESASVARRVRLTMPVAAAVRAALDWLAGREGVRQPLELRDDASVLEIACELRDAAGVAPAHEVISGVEGNLGPPIAPSGEAREGAWIIRVPSFSARPTYVMLEQGTLRLAVPWHAVLKLQVLPRDAIESRAARLGMNVLAPLSPLARRGSESPVVIVAHGLRRAWLVADRLVWRLAADACEAESISKEAGLTRAVCTDDGEVFGLAEPRMLLAGSPLPPFPRVSQVQPLSEAPVPPAPAPALARESSAASEGAVALDVHTPASAAPAAAPALTVVDAQEAGAEPEVLDERWVTPLPVPGEAGPVAGGPESAGTTWDEGTPREPAAEDRTARRALVAEDSITARIFLTRLLEQQGFEVVAVEHAADLHAALAGGPWSLVCVDAELPDARGVNLLRSVRGRIGEETPLVALARDDHDVAAARVAGVRRTLLKPVEPGALRRLLARLGLAGRASG